MTESRLFAIGDIHGCFGSLREMVEDKIRLKKEDKLVLLGDYIDRGRQSREVVDYIREQQGKGFDITTLSGNHEAMLLDAIDGGTEHLLLWLYNGGSATMKSFNIYSPGELDPEYVEFFRNLQYNYGHENFLFVHAGFNDDETDPFADKYHMIWQSRDSYSNPKLAGKTVIHGHRPVLPEQVKFMVAEKYRVLNIDTGCVYTGIRGYGRLTAIELNSMELFFTDSSNR